MDNSYKNIHFIGIGGVSMSGLAQIINEKKIYSISGSDIASSPLTEKLKASGIKIYIGHKSSNISKNLDLVVYTAAIKNDNPELSYARNLGIKTLERSEFLGEIMKDYKHPICISGTHGKTTTSSMVSEIFMCAKTNPTISLGGILSSIKSNIKIGSKDYFILESCEYCESFLKFNPHSAIILNIDEDHLDYFKDLDHIYKAFKNFANLIPKDGVLVINKDIKNYEFITEDLKCSVITYGQDKNAHWQAKNISFDENGFPTYEAFFKGKKFTKIKLNVTGLHNVYNSLASIAIASFYGLEISAIEYGLTSFKGTSRRFEFKGKFNSVTIIDDYAHHPTEIIATINAAKNRDINKLWCVFQPHTFTRTKALLMQFAQSFKYADEVIILDIYAAREKDTGEIHAKDLVEKIKSLGKNAIYMESFEKAKEYLSTNCHANDMLITMGAGDVYLLGEMLL